MQCNNYLYIYIHNILILIIIVYFVDYNIYNKHAFIKNKLSYTTINLINTAVS